MILVIYLFLWSFRASLVPLLAIPVSLIGVLAFLNLMGFSINNLTLLAMVLAIGLVVDDAIVILENIYKKMEEGQSKMKAVIEGTKEITFSVIAMTFTLVAVYIPLAFSFGASGLMFREFAVVLAGSVVISGVVALTLSPMMCGKFLKTDDVLHSKDNFSTAMLTVLIFYIKNHSN